MRIDLSCPIELIAYQLPTAEQSFCSLVFFNLSEKKVTSVQVTLICYDQEGNQTLRRLMRVMDLSGEKKQSFEALVPVEEEIEFTQIDVMIEKVWFEDNTVWRRTLSALHDYVPNDLPPTRLLEHLRFVAGKDASGFPSDQGPVWVCVCGRPNAASEAFCRRCGRDKLEQFDKYSREAVEEIIGRRERELEEKALRARQEASEKEHQRQLQLQKRKRRQRAMVATLISLCVLAVGALAFWQFGVPELAYRRAEGMLQEGRPGEAKLAFEELGEYRDAPERVIESEYEAALLGLESEDENAFDYGLSRMKALGAYRDAPEQVQKASYRRGQALIDQEAYEEAVAVLTEVGEYEDAPELRAKALYEIAQQEMTARDYEAANLHFIQAGIYLDASERAMEALYLAAGEYEQEEDFSKAAALYATVYEYEDAADRARENQYAYAMSLMDAHQYTEAREEFRKINDYLDAQYQADECIYLMAMQAEMAKDYESAYDLYASIPTHREGEARQAADRMIYLPAIEAKIEGDFDKAIELLALIPEYEDAEHELKAAIFAKANQLQEEKHYEEAAELFESLGEYDKSAERAQNLRYMMAEELLAEGAYTEAKEAFDALGSYKEAEQMASEADYLAATALKEEGLYSEAQVLFEALGSYKDAAELAKECTYQSAMGLKNEGRYEQAITLFASLGKYSDANSQMNDATYKQAEALLASGDYQQAGALFDSLDMYSDAKERAEQVYENWLGTIRDEAQAAIDAENWVEAITVLEDLPFQDLPNGYRQLSGMYEDSVLSFAKYLYENKNKLAAKPYLELIPNMKEASRLLEDFIYHILGQWESTAGSSLTFREDGTCLYDGQEMYFDVEGYAVLIGDYPFPRERTHSIVTIQQNKLALKREEDGKTINYERVTDGEGYDE